MWRSFKIEKPAGFGALAMSVSPPPTMAPPKTAEREASLRSTLWAASEVMAALSVTEVSAIALK